METPDEIMKPVFSPNLFSFEQRPTKKVALCLPVISRVPKLEYLVCGKIAFTSGLDLTKLSEKCRAILLLHSLKYNIKRTVRKILLTWPSRNFKLKNESCQAFIKSFDESLSEASLASFFWSKYLALLSCYFIELIYEGRVLKLENLEIQCFPYVFSPDLPLFLHFPVEARPSSSEEENSSEDEEENSSEGENENSSEDEEENSSEGESSKCCICLNVQLKDAESLHNLLEILRRKHLFKFKVNSIKFDFSYLTPEGMTTGNFQILKKLCQKLCLNSLQGIEVAFAAGANFFLKQMITNLFKNGIFQSITSLSFVKYIVRKEGIIDFINCAEFLDNLKSLSFSHSALITRAVAVVDCFRSLTTLRLVKVGLCEYDLYLLKQYDPLVFLEHFDISHNKLCQVERMYAFCKLLGHWKSNLRTLESRHIQWEPEHFDYLDQECIEFENMERVNFSGNRISTGYLESLLCVRSLKHIMCDDPTLKEKFFEYKNRIDLVFVRNRCVLTPLDRPFFLYL